jgi:hypothetical protein
MSDPNDPRVPAMALHSHRTFLEFAPRCGGRSFYFTKTNQPLRIRPLGEKDIELASALLKKYQCQVPRIEYGKVYEKLCRAMAKYVRTSKHLQRIRWREGTKDCDSEVRDKLLFTVCFSRKYVAQGIRLELPSVGGPSNLAFETCWPNTHGFRL